ncbi:MAG: dihydrofolate reductase family protein [Arthrobacter koreensis]|jgi:dihydrofolate reductase|uniref:dihydrofolate reductase family protein n=1 Tax=Arthrobacter koreensis TaxID=199136 RepID=UPI0024091263|nr:dihydrofolate reductase family protein [Arthrobacter koreensis]MDF2496550.1 dihydrofolate reductase family protein [Arthrobacter koreensis]
MAVRVDLNISLDGYATTTDQTPEKPFGEDWGRLVGPYTATRTFQERVLKQPGKGTTGVDDTYAAAYFEGIGAEIMGAGMFGLHNFPDDPEWKGWWGDETPFQYPVFILTHDAREPIDMPDGTRFEFLAASPQEALDRALDAAAGQDVRIGGGPTVIKSFLEAGLVDRIHVGITPILLGRGINLWEGLRGLENGYKAHSEAADDGVTHLTFFR